MGWACRRLTEGDRVTLRVLHRHLGYNAVRDSDFHVPSPEGATVVVDLADVRFVWPFGLVFLEWYIQDLLRRGAEAVEVRVPSLEVGSYLVRMRILAAFEGEDRVRFDVPMDVEREQDGADVLVEFERFRVPDADTVEALAERLVRVVVGRTDLGVGYGPLFLTVSEIIGNVHAHSGREGGTVAAQTYDERVCLAFGDAGVGIPEKLASRYPRKPPSALIERALEPGISTRTGGDGMGLADLSELIGERGHRLVLHSATGQVAVTPEGTWRRGGCCPVRGTLVEVEMAGGR